MIDPRDASANPPAAGDRPRKVVPFFIGDQLFGIPVLDVRDVLPPQPITSFHPAPPEIAGLLNLRGRIVTALEIRHRLGLSRAQAPNASASIVVEHAGELYSILVDRIGDVIGLATGDIEPGAPSIHPLWRDILAGVYRVKDRLLVLMDSDRLLRLVLKGKV
jgi:purine-binding chemotaxis protein CheW